MHRYGVIVSLLAWSGGAWAGPLPALPPGPVFEKSGYPTCQKEYLKATTRTDRYGLARDCIDELERYNRYILPRFPASVNEYSKQLNAIELAFRSARTPPADKTRLAELVRRTLQRYQSLDKNGHYGPMYYDYYMYVQAYKDDERHLRLVEDNQ